MDTLTLEWQHDGEQRSHTIIPGKETSIGRMKKSDIELPFETVSRRHAVIVKDGPLFYLQNLSKTNDIYVSGGVQLSEGQRAALQPGDEFRIGPIKFQVAQPPQLAAQTAPARQIVCAQCNTRVAYVPGGLCPVCQAPLSDALTSYAT